MVSNPNIHNVKETKTDYAKVVIYGAPGSGKTTFGATFPDVLFLSAESGLLSIRDREDVDAWTIDSWEDLEEAFIFLKREEHKYRSVVIDSLSECQKKLNEHIVKKFPGKRRDYEDLMSMSDWGYSMDRLRRMCRAFRDLPMNVVFITLDVTEITEEETFIKPALSGKTLPDELMGWVDAVVYCAGPQKDEDGNVHYLGQTVPGKGRRAKIRVPAGTHVPSVIELGFDNLYRIMFPEKTGKAA